MEGKAAMPCATTYILSQKKVVDFAELRREVERFGDASEFDSFLEAWDARKKDLPDVDLPEHHNKLLRYALFGDTSDEHSGYWSYSWCRGSWVQDSNTWHCRRCGEFDRASPISLNEQRHCNTIVKHRLTCSPTCNRGMHG